MIYQRPERCHSQWSRGGGASSVRLAGMRRLRILALISAFTLTAAAQTAVEYSLGTAGSTGAATGMRGVGKSLAGAFAGVNRTLGTAEKPGVSGATVVFAGSVPAAAASSPAIVPKPIDPSKARIGATREELLKQCGEPSTRSSETTGGKLVETYWYDTTTHDTLEVTLRDGKVTAITPESKKPHDVAAVTL